MHDLTNQYETYKNNDEIKKIDYHYGGQAYVTGATPALVASEVKILILCGLFLMCLILLINFRTIRFADFGPKPGNFEISVINFSIADASII